MAVIGTSAGELFAYTARDNMAIGKDAAHESEVTAMDTGSVSATGAKIVASASRTDLIVHEVLIKDANLLPIAKVCAKYTSLDLP